MLSRNLKRVVASGTIKAEFAKGCPSPGGEGSFSIRRLSLTGVRRLGAQRAFGADTTALWPGLRSHIADRLARRRTFVVAALSRKGTPVCWAGFRANRLDTSIWHYGNLFTEPTYRRRGLACEVVRAGVDAVSGEGGRCVYCFVDERNRPSVLAHLKLGFQPTGLMKSNPARGFCAPPGVRLPDGLEPLAESELIERIHEYVGNRFGNTDHSDACMILEFLLPNLSLLPWRRPQEHSVCLRRGDIDLYGRIAPGGRNTFLGLHRNGAWSSQSLRMLLDDPAARFLLLQQHSALLHEEWGPAIPSVQQMISYGVYTLALQ